MNPIYINNIQKEFFSLFLSKEPTKDSRIRSNPMNLLFDSKEPIFLTVYL